MTSKRFYRPTFICQGCHRIIDSRWTQGLVFSTANAHKWSRRSCRKIIFCMSNMCDYGVFVIANFPISRRNFFDWSRCHLDSQLPLHRISSTGSYPEHKFEVNNLSEKEVFLYRILGNFGLSLLIKDFQAPEVMTRPFYQSINYLSLFQRENVFFSALPLAFEHGTVLHHLEPRHCLRCLQKNRYEISK